MPRIDNTVGEKGINSFHDVALVQAMLRIVKDAKGHPFLNVPYSGLYDAATKTAITALQVEHKLAAPPPPPGPPAALPAPGANPPAAKLDAYGQVGPKSDTFAKIVALLPGAYADVTVIKDTKTVYLPGTEANRDASHKAIVNDPELEQAFRGQVGDLVNTVFERHRIVLWLTPTGSRRTFAQQAQEVNTKAGPGESNHNFGRAVDIGFRGLRWVRGDGSLKADADWLNALEALSAAKANAFWDARDTIALNEIKLHRLGFERVHLQGFDNAAVSSGRSLVALLNADGAMSWGATYAKPAWQYKSDFGLGGALFTVGTSKQIWAGNAVVTKANLAAAQAAKGAKVTAADITEKQIAEMKRALKADFEAADQNWIDWVPVP